MNPLFCLLCPLIINCYVVLNDFFYFVYWRRKNVTICFLCVVYLVTVVSWCFCVFFDKERRGVFPRGGGGAKYTQKRPAINKRHNIKQQTFGDINTNYIEVKNHVCPSSVTSSSWANEALEVIFLNIPLNKFEKNAFEDTLSRACLIFQRSWILSSRHLSVFLQVW